MRHIHGNSWLGMTLKTPGTIPSKWDDKSPVTYLNFQKNRPSDDATKMCVFIHGQAPRSKVKKRKNSKIYC